MQYLCELEKDEYEPQDFVERLAWRSNSDSVVDDFKTAAEIVETFLSAILDLQSLQIKQESVCLRLQEECREEEQLHWRHIASLLQRNKSALAIYKSLDEKINSAATKVLHLGNQLEGVNIPRCRDVEAKKLLHHFDSFIEGEAMIDPMFSDKARLYEAADIILKLQTIVQEFPDDKFREAKLSIDSKYCEIENCLIEEFMKSQRSSDLARMRDLAVILVRFRSYNSCIDSFIEHTVQLHQTKFKSDIFKTILPLVDKGWNIIEQVFPNPKEIMSKFLLNVYQNLLKDHINATLAAHKTNLASYLSNLYVLHCQTTKLTHELSHYGRKLSDKDLLPSLTVAIFKTHCTEEYIRFEMRHLNEQCTQILQKFYSSKGHQKKMTVDLKRDLQDFINSKSSHNISSETFLSEEVVISLLQLTKASFIRCGVLSSTKEVLSQNVSEIFRLSISYVLHEYTHYALDLASHAPDPKSVPELYFFEVMSQVKVIVHLFQKQYDDVIKSMLDSESLNQLLKSELKKLEDRLEVGLERTLNTLVGWVRTILSNEQKKTDFNPPDDIDTLASCSPACKAVVAFVDIQVAKIRSFLDERTVRDCLSELAFLLHRVIYDHLRQFTYNSNGALCVICDVQSYRRTVASFGVFSSVIVPYDTLYAMCNLLMFPPTNLRDACQGEHLKGLNRDIIQAWIQLRTDYKINRLATFL